MPDSAKSAAFYARIFGGPIWKNNKTLRRYVKLGPCYIAIEQGREPFGVDHFSVAIEGYRIADIHSYLDQRGIGYKDYPSGKDLNVTDPDGIHVQLSADNTGSQLAGSTASSESGEPKAHTSQAQSIFRPTGLDHISVECFGSGKIYRVFYEKIFGAVTGATITAPGSRPEGPGLGYRRHRPDNDQASTTSAFPPYLSITTPPRKTFRRVAHIRKNRKQQEARVSRPGWTSGFKS